MPKIDLTQLPILTGSSYPAEFDRKMVGRSLVRVGDAGGLTQFGANITILAPGAKSSMRHWHEEQDELVIITQGTCTLVDDHGTTEMTAGEVATFKAGDANGHCFENRSNSEARFLVIGTRTPTETGWYSDVDLMVAFDAGGAKFTHKDGSPFEGTDND